MKYTNFASTLTSSLLSSALAIGVLISAPAATAQRSGTIVKADIPFAFQAGSQRLPAGLYQIDLMSDHQVLFRGPGNASGFVLVHSTQSLKRASKGVIVFDRYGTRNYLHQIWTAGDSTGRELPKSRAEQETSQAEINHAPTLVELALISDPRR
jgi:hypothetical protein